MTVFHGWSLLSLFLLALNIALEGFVLALCVRRGLWRSLLMLPVFAGFCLFMDVCGTWVALQADASMYSAFYWTGETLGTAVIVLLCVQMAIVILPAWKRPILVLWSVLALVFLLILATQTIPAERHNDYRLLLIVADVVSVGLLLLIASMTVSRWPLGYGFMIVGLVVSTILHLALSLVGYPFIVVGYPLASLFGMLLLLAGAVLNTRQERSETAAA